MSELQIYNEKTFEDIKHIDEYGNEYWEARELMVALEYSKWENFHKVIKKAMLACDNSKNNVFDHFPEVRKTIEMPKTAIKEVLDYKLSRYACYLIVQNGNPKKEVVALGQTYFAIQTRKQELTEKEYYLLVEAEKGFEVSRELFLSDWPEFVVTEATREAAKKNPHITDVRLRRGMFRTDEEEEQRRERLRALPLPSDEIEEKPKVMKKIKRYLKID